MRFRSRPDLASYRAQAREAAANVGVIKGQGLPDLFLSGATSHTFAQKSSLEGSTYSALVGLSFPVFQGFTNSYDILQAREQANLAINGHPSLCARFPQGSRWRVAVVSEGIRRCRCRVFAFADVA